MSDVLDRIRGNARTAAENLIDPENIKKPETFEEAYAAYTRETAPLLQTPSAGGGAASSMPVPAQYVQAPSQFPLEGELGFGTGFKMGMIADHEKELRMLSEQTGIPLERMGYINGEPVFVDQKTGNFQKFTNGWGGLGEMAASAPEILGGIAGTVIGGTRGKPDAGGAAGAMAGLSAKKFLANLIWDDPIGVGDLGEVALEGVMDYGFAKALPGGTKLLRRQGVPGVERNVASAELEAQREAIKRATGIDLDLAQMTNLEALKRLKTWARNYPGQAGEVIRAHDDLVDGQSAEAIERLATLVARAEDPFEAGLRGINAATASIDLARAEVNAISSPLYRQAAEEALQNGTKVDTQPVVDMLLAASKDAKGDRKTALARALDTLYVGGKRGKKDSLVETPDSGRFRKRGPDKGKHYDEKPELDTSIEGLHQAKMALDAMIDPVAPSKSLDNWTRNDLIRIKDALVKQIEDVSETYGKARAAHEEGMRTLVEPLEQSIVGVLSRLQPYAADKAAAKLFAGGAMPASGIRKARAAIKNAEANDPALAGTWDGLVARWLRQNLNEALKPTQTGEATNTAGKWLKRAFGSPDQQAALKEALGKDAYKQLSILVDALQMAARTPTGSSATEFNRLISEQMGEGAVTLLQRVFRPIGTTAERLQAAQLDGMALALSEALTDPAKRKQLRKLAEMPKSTERSLGLVGLVMSSSALSGAQGLLNTPEEGMTVE